LEAIAFQTNDLIEAMERDAGLRLDALRVDGGASVNNALMQFQADLLNTVVRRPVVSETTALGAAYLAGLAVGYWTDLGDIAENWALEREFRPGLDEAARTRRIEQWKRAVQRTLRWESSGA
jgi:glycerol kinase